jgi:hypothetical protein
MRDFVFSHKRYTIIFKVNRLILVSISFNLDVLWWKWNYKLKKVSLLKWDSIYILMKSIPDEMMAIRIKNWNSNNEVSKSISNEYWDFSVILKLCVARNQTVKIFIFKLSKFSFSNCQNFRFQTVKIFLFKLSNYSFSNCQNFHFQTVKIFVFKLSKFFFSNCQIIPFQTVKFFVFELSKFFYSN